MGRPSRGPRDDGLLERVGQDRGKQDALAVGPGNGPLEERAQFLGLAQHQPRGIRDPSKVRGNLVGHGRERLRDIGEIGPDAAIEPPVVDDLSNGTQAAQHDEVERVLGIEQAHHLRRPIRAHQLAFRIVMQPFLERTNHPDGGQVLERVDQPRRRHASLQQERDAAPRSCQDFDGCGRPDGRTVDGVEVDIAVHEGVELPRG